MKTKYGKPLPCPFCGGNRQAMRYDPLENIFWIMCKKCKVQGPSGLSEAWSIEKWNTRGGMT